MSEETRLHCAQSYSILQCCMLKAGWLTAGLCAQGFAVQGYVTGEGPYANWAKHVSDPCAPSFVLMHVLLIVCVLMLALLRCCANHCERVTQRTLV